MEKVVWKGEIMEGMEAEYVRRHDEIWPEMVKALKDSGISNYTIWKNGRELFGYYECPSKAFAAQFKQSSEVMCRWSESMKNVMHMVQDEDTGANVEFDKVFELE